MFKSISWKLMLVYLLMILFVMQLMGLYFMKSIEDYHMQTNNEKIQSQAGVLADLLERYFVTDEERERDLDTLVSDFAKQLQADIQVIDRDGIVLSDSKENKAVGQRNVQIEVTRALLGSRGEAIRIENETGNRMKIIANPIRVQGELVGAVYISSSLESIYEMLHEINNLISTATFMVMAISSVLVVIIARTITSPIVEVTRKATEMADGNFEQTVTIHSDDEIGELGQAFNQLTVRLKEALEENEKEKERITAVLNNMTDGVIATNGEGRILLINPAGQSMLGIKEEEAGAHSVLDLFEIEELKRHWFEIQNEPSFDTVISYGGRIYQVVATPLREARSIANGVLLMLHDITEREELEEQRKEFVANVSHELRTPLTTISSYIEALAEGAGEDPELRQTFTQVIQTETGRMIRLVTDLLELSQFEAHNISWDFSVFDMNELIEEVYDRYQVQLHNKNLASQLMLTTEASLVRADRDKIDQVLNNLLSNAIKFTQEGLISIQSQLVYEGDRPYVEVIVADTGVGIPDKDAGRIFDRFYRVDKARSREMGGTGLGLSISKQIIRSHHGEIGVKIDKGPKDKLQKDQARHGKHEGEGKGSRLYFRLPAYLAGGDDNAGEV